MTIVTTPSAKAKGFYPCVYHAERDCSPSLNNILASLLNRSFANGIEKGQFIPELKQGDFLHPVLKRIGVSGVGASSNVICPVSTGVLEIFPDRRYSGC